MVNPDEEVPVNEQSLFAEMGESNTFEFSGMYMFTHVIFILHVASQIYLSVCLPMSIYF